jgi:hypothetical protein
MSASGKNNEAEEEPGFSGADLVRLARATTGSLIASAFLVIYTRHAHFRFHFEHPDVRLINGNEALIAHGKWAFALPVIVLVFGLLLLYAQTKGKVAFELCIAGAWVSSLPMIVVPLLLWHTQNAPALSQMTWIY